jgi:hypothetical protein
MHHDIEIKFKADSGHCYWSVVMVKYLPPNVTALIQTMHQGVIATKKK